MRALKMKVLMFVACLLIVMFSVNPTFQEVRAAPEVRPSSWAEPIEGRPGLPNLHKVNERLYRGAQPEDGGFDELKRMGIKTVVNLRTLHSDRSECEKSGLDYVPISVQAWEAETSEVLEFLELLNDPQRHPVFVHCQHGADRTGMMVALYRMVIENWSREDAIREMTEGGFGFHSIWQNIVNYVQRVDVEALRRALAQRAEN